MRKAFFIFIILVAILSIVTFACSPKTTAPTTLPQPATPRATIGSPTPASNIPPLTSQTASQSSWDQIIAAAKKEGAITPYSFIFTGNFGTVIARAFEQRYGIKFSPVVGTGTLIMERIRSEQVAGKYIADTFDSAASLVATAKGDGLTVNIGPLPELDGKDKWRADPRLDPDGHFVGTYVITTTIYVNTNLVKPGEEPKSYKDLLDPKWKGKIIEASPVTSPSVNRVYLALKKSGLADDSFWQQLAKQDTRVTATVREAASALARGDASIYPTGQSSTMTPFILEGAPVKPINTTEGIIVSVGTPVAIVKNAPHPNAARVFINWVVSPEGQKLYQENLGVIPLHKDVPESANPLARVNLDKILPINMADELEIARIQRAGTVAQLLGVQR